MKKSSISTIVGFVLVMALGTINGLAATKTSKIRVEGMHCKMCSDSVTKALKATAGVEKVNVSSSEGEAVVEFDDQKVTEAQLREVINKTGFKAVANAEEGSSGKQ
jgi:copper chaperone CopZ